MCSRRLARPVPPDLGPLRTDGKSFVKFVFFFDADNSDIVAALSISWPTPTADEAHMPTVAERDRTAEQDEVEPQVLSMSSPPMAPLNPARMGRMTLPKGTALSTASAAGVASEVDHHAEEVNHSTLAEASAHVAVVDIILNSIEDAVDAEASEDAAVGVLHRSRLELECMSRKKDMSPR